MTEFQKPTAPVQQQRMAPMLNPPDAKAKPDSPLQRMSQAIAARLDAFNAVATQYLTGERLVKLAQAALGKTPALADCSTVSIVTSLMVCARLGLEPNEPGGVWLVPFGGVCTPVIDYRGMLDVARRSGDIVTVHVDIVCARDQFEYAIDTSGPTLVSVKHRLPLDGERGDMVGAYFIAKIVNQASKLVDYQAVYLSKKQIIQVRDRSKGYQAFKAGRIRANPWDSDFDAQAKKTAVRRGVNLLPRTPHLQMLRAELTREERDDADDEFGGPMIDVSEHSDEAIDRMLAAIAADDPGLATKITDAFQLMNYGPAKQLQLLTKHHDAPAGLLKELQSITDEKTAAAKPAGQQAAPTPTPAADAAPAPAETPAPPAVKNKGGRPKGSGKAQPAAPKPQAADEPPPPTDDDLKGASF